MSKTDFKIDLNESFATLSRAPIVEAVIHWRARVGKKLEPEAFLKSLSERLPDYPQPQRQQELHVGSEISPEGSSIQQRHVWHGFRFESEDKRYVAQFTRNGFVFSRLQPYEDWVRFEAEALRLWSIYAELTEPPEVQRLGVRFINVIPIKRMADVDDLLVKPPSSPPQMTLPLAEFMHQARYEIPGHHYCLNVIQTVQRQGPSKVEELALILDLEVSTTEEFGVNDENLKNRLTEIRWIKDKAFFSFLKPAAIERFKE